MGWKKRYNCCWDGTGVVEGFRIEYHEGSPTQSGLFERSLYHVFYKEQLLGFARTRSGANHCADEYSRLMLFERLGKNDPNCRPSLIGTEIWFQGRVLCPDELAGMNWICEGEYAGGHFRYEYLDWEDAWKELTRVRPQ
jgi:hypothetical protein